MKISLRQKENSARTNTSVFPLYIYHIDCSLHSKVFDLHWHEELEIILCQCSGTITIDDNEVPFHNNNILFVNKEQLHSLQAHTEGTIYCLLFDYSFLDFKTSDWCQTNIIDRLKEKRLLFPSILSEKNTRIWDILWDIIENYSVEDMKKCLRIKYELYELLYHFSEACLWINQDTSDENNSPLHIRYMKSTILYIETHYSESITIDDLANNLYISKGYLIKIFKHFVGETPIIYLRNFRLEMSLEQLKQGSSVTETALQCGFNNVSYFIRHFKDRFGTTPKQYMDIV